MGEWASSWTVVKGSNDRQREARNDRPYEFSVPEVGGDEPALNKGPMDGPEALSWRYREL